MKKLLLLLISVLLLCSCSGKGTKVIAQEFVGHNVQEVYAWCAELDDDHSCAISYADNGEYEKDIVFEQSVQAGKKIESEIQFKVSNGNQSEIALPFITAETTMSDIEVWKEQSNVTKLTYIYETSDTVEKNHVIRIEPNANVTRDTELKVYISSGKAEPVNTNIEIKYGDYIGITVSDFESKARALGLNPNHQTSRDKYDANVKIGNIVWHGSGTYEKGETFNYGVCINQINVTPGQYVGKTESDFIKTAKSINLNPVHITGRDSYSASVDKGNVVTHGYGTYVENEDFKYGLSYGPARVASGYEGTTEDVFLGYLDMLTLNGEKLTAYSDTVAAGRVISYNYGNYSTGDKVRYTISLGKESKKVNVPDFAGRPESELLTFLSNNGILVAYRGEQESTYSKGTVVYNDKGEMAVGSKITYTVASDSSGKAIIESFDTIYQHVTHEGDYEHARYDMHRYLFGRGFMNYDIVPVVYRDYEPGILLYISIDGEELGDYPVDVPLDSYIYCMISADYDQ